MKRSIVLGLIALLGLLWGCGDDKPTAPTNSAAGIAAESTPRLITKEQLIGEWRGMISIRNPGNTSQHLYDIVFTFHDSTFEVARPPDDPMIGQCPYLYAEGIWATDGHAFWSVNHSIYHMDCYRYPFGGGNLIGRPIWFEGNTLVMLETPIRQADSLIGLVYRDTLRLERVE